MAERKTLHPGWTCLIIAFLLLVLTLTLILTRHVPLSTLGTALLPVLALTSVGLLMLRSGK
ncbi:hypothetical protein [Deinococcus roseus]|nr:hypothetical protein [Deinococcus roseus]